MMKLHSLMVVGMTGVLALMGCKKPATATPAGGGGAMSIQVVAVEATKRPVTESLSLIGSTTANEMVELKSETDGLVEKINFEEGQQVEQGRLLVQLEESKLSAQLAEAEANFKFSQINYDRAKQLLTDKLISQQEYEQTTASFQMNQAGLDLKKRQLQDTKILAPFAGVVGSRSISPGQVITKSTTLTWVIDLDPVKVEFNVPEKFLSQLAIGQSIDVTVAAFPGRKFTGEVFFVSSYVDPNTRTALVKARIPNPKQELKPGMFANLDLTLRVLEAAIVVPEVAINQLLEGGEATLYVVDKENKATLRKVKLGVRTPGFVEVSSGVDAGDMVIVEGLQKIGPGVPVQLAPAEAAKPYQTN